jgi:hypothetical protein
VRREAELGLLGIKRIGLLLASSKKKQRLNHFEKLERKSEGFEQILDRV